MNRFNKFNKGDRLSANALNSLVDSLPKYDNITANGLYTDCGNGQVIIQTGKDKFGAVGEVVEKSEKKLYPFMIQLYVVYKRYVSGKNTKTMKAERKRWTKRIIKDGVLH